MLYNKSGSHGQLAVSQNTQFYQHFYNQKTTSACFEVLRGWTKLIFFEDEMSKIVKKLLSCPNAEWRHPSVTCWGWVWTSLTGGVTVSALMGLLWLVGRREVVADWAKNMQPLILLMSHRYKHWMVLPVDSTSWSLLHLWCSWNLVRRDCSLWKSWRLASKTTLLISHIPILPKILFLQCFSKPEWKHAAADFLHRLRIHHPTHLNCWNFVSWIHFLQSLTSWIKIYT